ncbi:MAG: tryptophan synthase subunit beta [Pseudomonas sp.]|uniref:tryptophan synthase subunit beta n=1 Tax=Pseudomonas sp. TaxID=306 RepID=UPI0033935AE2
MFYVQRDAQGVLLRVETNAFAGMTETEPSDAKDAQEWYAALRLESSRLQLKQSDLDMIRVLDDLIHLLMTKGVIRVTDLPVAAQSKLINRSQAREVLGGLNQLIDDEEAGVF